MPPAATPLRDQLSKRHHWHAGFLRRAAVAAADRFSSTLPHTTPPMPVQTSPCPNGDRQADTMWGRDAICNPPTLCRASPLGKPPRQPCSSNTTRRWSHGFHGQDLRIGRTLSHLQPSPKAKPPACPCTDTSGLRARQPDTSRAKRFTAHRQQHQPHTNARQGHRRAPVLVTTYQQLIRPSR